VDHRRRNGTRNPKVIRRRIEVWTMTIIAVWMDTMISTKQWTIVKVKVPVTMPIAQMTQHGLVCVSILTFRIVN
jgi:hypothetical protein